MSRVILFMLLSFFIHLSWATQSLPLIKKRQVRTNASCAHTSVFVKFRNHYVSPMYPLFFATTAIEVASPLSQYIAYALPRGDSDVLGITFLADKSAMFFGETYLIKQEGSIESEDMIEQKCEVASYCECKGPRCYTSILTNGSHCNLMVEDESKENGTITNPYIIVTQ